MIFNYDNKTLQVKIVYYGPAMSGKTTSLKYLFNYFGKEDLIESIESSMGRTLFFDFGVLPFKGADWDLKFLLYSATGQDFYASTRPATLKGVDGIIFVVDSQTEYLEYNLRSWNELKAAFGSEFYSIPTVISLNKCDLLKSDTLEKNGFLSCIDFNRFSRISFKKTIAIEGKGVLDSFSEVIKFIFPQLKINLNINN